MSNTNRKFLNFLTIVILVVMVAIGYFWIDLNKLSLTFLIYILLFIGFFIIMGYLLCESAFGILIDNRNKISLSRLQLVLWTTVVLSALFIMAFANTEKLRDSDTLTQNGSSTEEKGPLDIEIPEEIWWLLGISTTSMVGSPLIRALRNDSSVPASGVPASGVPASGVPASGVPADVPVAPVIAAAPVLPPTKLIHLNSNLQQASFWDVFKGEEISNFTYIDMAKLQMFFFTVVIIFTYIATIMINLKNGQTNEFPSISQGLVVLLGISHAGYLTFKGLPK